MKKKYLAFFHYEGSWFGYVTDHKEKRNSVNWMLFSERENSLYFLSGDEKLSKKEILAIIHARFPEYIPIHVIEWREGPRRPGECGSRVRKIAAKRDYLRDSKIVRY